MRIDRLEPGGTLRRIVVSYAEPARSGRRPVLLAVAGGDCRISAGRRLTYYEDGMARTLEHLAGDLERVVRSEPLNPPVPDGAREGARPGGARGLRGELPAAGDRLPARPRPRRRPRGLRFLGSRPAPLRFPPRPQRVLPAAPRDAHRGAAARGGAGRGARALSLSAQRHVEDAPSGRGRGGGRGADREPLDGQPPPLRVGRLRGGGAGAPGDAVRGLRRERRRRHRRGPGLPRLPSPSTTCSRSPPRTIPGAPRLARTGVARASTSRCRPKQSR